MRFLGIDPGQSGGLACITFGIDLFRQSDCWKMPATERDTAALFRHIKEAWSPSLASIEAVHSMPGQGVSSSFKFGKSYGFLRGLLIAYEIPFIEVSPHKWQKDLGCLSKGDKNVTKSRAQQLYPTLKITHATADALLIANWTGNFGILNEKWMQDWKDL
jgi:crossover junction endodeoxyribonuclease RuvC